MRVFVFLVAATAGLLANRGPVLAAQPTAAPAPLTQIVDIDQLVELGKSVAAIRYESDNEFVYAELSDGLQQTAQSLVGGQIEFHASVMRVNTKEVFVEVVPAGKTRLILMHAVSPLYGNLRTVIYPGPASTRRLQMFSAPVGLRIGSEIRFEVAKTLRRRDTLVIRGTIASLPVWVDSVFAPDAVALIANWSVVEVNPEPSY